MKKVCVVCGREFERRNAARCSECQSEHVRAMDRERRRNPERIEWMRKYHHIWNREPENRKRKSELKRKPENRARARELQREYRGRPEIRARLRSIERAHYHAPSHIEMNREMARDYMREWERRHSDISKATQRFFLSMKLGEAMQSTNIEHMKKKTAIVKHIPTVQEFIAAFFERVKGIEQSCIELAAMVAADASVFDQIVKAEPRFNYNMLSSMLKVGKGELYCELLFDPSLAARKLLPLPSVQQRKLYSEPVKIVKLVAGKHVVESKPIKKMSRHELSLVIDSDRKCARTVEEQIAFVQPPAPAQRADRFKIEQDGQLLRVLCPTEFTLVALEEIVARMKKQAIESLAT